MVGTIIMISLSVSLWVIILMVLIDLIFNLGHAFIFGCILIVYFVTSVVTVCYLFGGETFGGSSVMIMPYIAMLH